MLTASADYFKYQSPKATIRASTLHGSARGCERVRICFFLIRRERLECNFPGNAMQLRLAPLFIGPFYFRYRVQASRSWPSTA